jgi:hypothetical protein
MRGLPERHHVVPAEADIRPRRTSGYRIDSRLRRLVPPSPPLRVLRRASAELENNAIGATRRARSAPMGTGCSRSRGGSRWRVDRRRASDDGRARVPRRVSAGDGPGPSRPEGAGTERQPSGLARAGLDQPAVGGGDRLARVPDDAGARPCLPIPKGRPSSGFAQGEGRSVLSPGASGVDQLTDRGTIGLSRRHRLLRVLWHRAHAPQCVDQSRAALPAESLACGGQ